MKAEAAEDARRWEAEQEAERKRKESMILTQEEKDKILQVIYLRNFYQSNVTISIDRVSVQTGQ